MLLSVRHSTNYVFDEPPVYALQRVRLEPKPTHGQRVIEWSMELHGARHEVSYDDHFNNHTALISFEPGAREVTITCAGLVESGDTAGILGKHQGAMPLWAFADQTPLTRPGPQVRALIAGLSEDRSDKLALLHELSAAVLSAVRYEVGSTDAATTAEQAAALGAGVCQDHAHIFIGATRALGLPARYVSGYLMMDDQISQEAGHAWAEAHVPALGWVGFDVSNGISPDGRYVRVATGRDYRDAAPVTGIAYGTVDSALRVDLAVEQQTVEQ